MSKILVIDDDRGVRALLDTLLRQKGYDVVLAGNGQTGLELFCQETPDAIVLDLKMPKWMGWRSYKKSTISIQVSWSSF